MTMNKFCIAISSCHKTISWSHTTNKFNIVYGSYSKTISPAERRSMADNLGPKIQNATVMSTVFFSQEKARYFEGN